ncbi:hypothetical protein [Ferruginibacter sp.]
MKNIFLLIFFIAFFGTTGTAQVVNIPDANFKQALLAANPSIDLNNDGQIQVSEALLVDQIDVNNKNISDLTGIQSFKISLFLFAAVTRSPAWYYRVLTIFATWNVLITIFLISSYRVCLYWSI